MDLTLPPYQTTGYLSGSDLTFFYYDIGLDHLQQWPKYYTWDEVVNEFKEELDIKSCTSSEMPTEFVPNTIRFRVSEDKKVDGGSKPAVFFRHLRNAFSHYSIVRERDNFRMIDKDAMIGLVNAELLKKFCSRFFDIREHILTVYENTQNPTI